MPEPGPVRLRTNVQPDLPPISLDHLAAMSDDTGIFQHAVHAIADRSHGYCIDDNARALLLCCGLAGGPDAPLARRLSSTRSEEHTSELQSLMRISYAVFCLKKKKKKKQHPSVDSKTLNHHH